MVVRRDISSCGYGGFKPWKRRCGGAITQSRVVVSSSGRETSRRIRVALGGFCARPLKRLVAEVASRREGKGVKRPLHQPH